MSSPNSTLLIAEAGYDDSSSWSTVSNFERAKWRRVCREALAKHISEATGIQIQPKNVRLQPRATDPYRWSVTEEGQDLFQKCISRHSTSTFVRLTQEIGVTFSAVNAADRMGNLPQQSPDNAPLLLQRVQREEQKSAQWEGTAQRMHMKLQQSAAEVVELRQQLAQALSQVEAFRSELGMRELVIANIRRAIPPIS